MNQQTEKIGPHPQDDQLVAFIESPSGTELTQVRQHLVACSICRMQAAAFQKTLQTLREAPFSSTLPEGSHPDEIELAGYVEKTLSGEEAAKIGLHIAGCSACTEDMLFYALHTSNEMPFERTAALPISPIEPKERSRPTWKSLTRNLVCWRMPAWIGIPATALAAVLLVVLALRFQKQVRIISYQEELGVVFMPSERLPGIGFFEAAREESKPFGGMQIQKVDDHRLHFAWSSIENALEYRIQIYTLQDGKKTLLAEARVKNKTDAILEMSEIKQARGYRWELSGTTKENKRFLTTGGFAMGNDD